VEFRIMKVLLARFARDESGSAAVEYGLIAAAMSAAIITMILGLGSKVTIFASAPIGPK
jgi:pilus assembly protein Flp/PilA